MYGFKTPSSSLPMFLCSLHETHCHVLAKIHIFSPKLALSMQGKLYVPGLCRLDRCFGVYWSAGEVKRFSALSADIIAFHT